MVSPKVEVFLPIAACPAIVPLGAGRRRISRWAKRNSVSVSSACRVEALAKSGVSVVKKYHCEYVTVIMNKST
jgi:hypothetical protein